MISVALAAPAALGGSPAPFTEEAVERGVDYLVGIPGVWMNGVAFVDLDNDGDPDLVVTGRGDGVVGVYENDGTGHFIDRSSGNGIPVLGASTGVVAGDYDADGDLDLYFSLYYMANVLVRNEGEFQFTDATLGGDFGGGVGDSGFGTGCAWADYDNDGRLDLYLANHTSQTVPDMPNRLYRNLGEGTFIDVASGLGVND
ncbi:MAG: VCBS repeat-containing protein, partial [Thermoanaerobaculia bacterium]